jgi:hypothetical protein
MWYKCITQIYTISRYIIKSMYLKKVKTSYNLESNEYIRENLVIPTISVRIDLFPIRAPAVGDL